MATRHRSLSLRPHPSERRAGGSSRRAGIPYCVTVHGAIVSARHCGAVALKKTIFNLFFERRYLNEARFIHALSPHETEVIRRTE